MSPADVNADSMSTPRKSIWLSSLTDILNQPVWKVAGVALTGSLLINALFVVIGLNDRFEFTSIWFYYFSYSIAIAFTMWMSMGYLNAWLAQQVDWLGKPWTSFGIAVVSNLIVAVFALGLINFIFDVVVSGDSLAEWWLNQTINRYIGSILIGLLITAIYQSAWFIRLWKASILQAEQLKSANLSAKYEALNAQVNPHFLFNSLNVLSSLVRRDPAAAERFIQGLSSVYRYVLDVRNESLVELEREVEMLLAYGELLETRFGDRLVLDVQLSPKPDQRVVPLALQMLVENAVKHNGATRKQPLHVSVSCTEEWLVVRNNRVHLYEPVEGKGIGLQNIRERYELAAEAHIEIVQTDDSYEVRLPLLTTHAEA